MVYGYTQIFSRALRSRSSSAASAVLRKGDGDLCGRIQALSKIMNPFSMASVSLRLSVGKRSQRIINYPTSKYYVPMAGEERVELVTEVIDLPTTTLCVAFIQPTLSGL